ncbi:MAG: polysaccharide deacetylase family protein [Paraclostridium sp.]
MDKILKKTLFVIFIIGIVLLIPINQSIHAQNNENFIKNGPRDKKYLAITFDDGPHPKETDEVLDILKKYDVKATFFIAGKHANWYNKPLKRTYAEGHEIGNHTFSHPDISNLSNEQLENEIIKCEEELIKVTGEKPKLFRPPYGSYRQKELSQIANKLEYKVVLWTTVDAKDWKNPGAQNIANVIINNAKNGDIILLHDYATQDTVKALDIFIPEMQKKGYKFVTVSELCNLK